MSEERCCCGGNKKEEEKKPECCFGGDSKAEQEPSCCCGDSSDSCCCGDSGDCCSDDPNTGHKEVVIVDYLYLDLSVCDRCQGTDERVAKAVEAVRPIMAMAGY